MPLHPRPVRATVRPKPPNCGASMLLEPWHMWVIAGVVLMIIEVVTPGFVVICFGLGCLAAGLAAWAGAGSGWEIVTFSAASLAMLLGIRPLVTKHLGRDGGELKTNVDALVGKRGLVTESIDAARDSGRVAVGGDDWRASSDGGEALDEGASVEVVRVEGARVIVKPV